MLQAQDPWKPVQFLVGEWVGEGSGAPGEGSGACSFEFDVQHKVMIRKNYAIYPNARHDDLMVIYVEDKVLKAIYFDSEDHVIHYKVEPGEDSVRFTSESYRLIYKKMGDKVALDFEIAPPGKPFSSYLHAVLKRK
jgi:hypothetical protein